MRCDGSARNQERLHQQTQPGVRLRFSTATGLTKSCDSSKFEQDLSTAGLTRAVTVEAEAGSATSAGLTKCHDDSSLD